MGNAIFSGGGELMEIISIRPLLAILVSVIAGFLILTSKKNPNLRETWTFIAGFIKLALVLSLIPDVMNGNTIVFRFFEILPGVDSSLRVDACGLFFAIVSSSLWIITSIYSIGYMRTLNEKEQTRYYFSFALSLSAAIGIAFSGDLITFFVFYEMLTLATYPLVAHKENKDAIMGGRKYLVYSLSAGALLLGAIAWIYALTGTLTFTPGGFLDGSIDYKILAVLATLLIYGCSVKAALFPLHAWLPTAMVAPTPVSALLHAVAVVKAGVFGILRVVGYVLGPDLLKTSDLWFPFACIAAFTIIFASCIALAQDNLKRRLAYSTISQLSYILLGALLVSPDAYKGALIHLSNHAMMKITLFFCAGAIYAKLHKENISDMKGIGYKMPGTMIAFTVAAIGLSGFPPFSGFVSKWFLSKGAIDSAAWFALFAYLGSALLNAAYLLPVVKTAFTRNLPTNQKEIAASLSAPRNDETKTTSLRTTNKPVKQSLRDEKPWALTFPPIATALLTILFGSIPFLIKAQLSLAEIAVQGVFGVRL